MQLLVPEVLNAVSSSLGSCLPLLVSPSSQEPTVILSKALPQLLPMGQVCRPQALDQGTVSAPQVMPRRDERL